MYGKSNEIVTFDPEVKVKVTQISRAYISLIFIMHKFTFELEQPPSISRPSFWIPPFFLLCRNVASRDPDAPVWMRSFWSRD